MPKTTKPTVLIILDGWGVAPASKGNAITQAKTPTMNLLWKKYPHTILKAHGKSVGLLPKQDGNSEAGHMNLGAGRKVEQDCSIILEAIKNKTFFKNAAFLEAIRHVKKHKSKLHILSLFSTSMSAHSHPDCLLMIFNFLRFNKIKKIHLHLFTDGRDSPKYAAINLLKKIKRSFNHQVRISSIIGRSYAMDRGKRWSKTELAYNAMVLGEGIKLTNPEEAILQAYNRDESDEFIQPTVLLKKNHQFQGLISNNDALIFLNFRSDRARQLTKPFVQKYFDGFNRRKSLKNLCFVTLTDFGPDLGDILSAFPSKDVEQTLPAVLKNRRQIYIAETEKYAHITYFFNGGFADPIGGEERILVPSPKESYEKVPEMSTPLITKTFLDLLKKNFYHFIALNFANPDMVGHTGNLQAGIKAVESVDKYLRQIVKAVLRKKGTIIITADHGNIEEMINLKTGEIDTEHSTNPVPLIVVHEDKRLSLKQGILGDVAPTILELMKIEKPSEMKGRSLIR
jgi:2,3-bisphosphoglycerate-independent phosphoglycerate mutase